MTRLALTPFESALNSGSVGEKMVGAGIVRQPLGQGGDRFPLSLALKPLPPDIRAMKLVDTHPARIIRGVMGPIGPLNLDVDPLWRSISRDNCQGAIEFATGAFEFALLIRGIYA